MSVLPPQTGSLCPVFHLLTEISVQVSYTIGFSICFSYVEHTVDMYISAHQLRSFKNRLSNRKSRCT